MVMVNTIYVPLTLSWTLENTQIRINIIIIGTFRSMLNPDRTRDTIHDDWFWGQKQSK